MTLLYLFTFVIVSLLTVVSGEIPTFSYEQRILRHNRKHNRSQPPLPKALLRSQMAHAYPEPLPTAPRKLPSMDPYHKFKQGTRRRGDLRVYNQKFDYEPQDSGQRMTCSAITNCYITHLVIDTDNAVPMLVSGGFGYTYFFVIINGKPADRLSGRLRAYCMKPKQDPAIRSNRPMKMAVDTDSDDISDDD